MQEDTLKEQLKQYNNELELVYNNFNLSFSHDSQIDDISKYQIFAGGKRIRPILIFIISNLFNNSINNDTINFATAVELLHNATLIHDDIIDESTFRRQKETVRAKFGDSKAILSGDYLFTYAFDYVINLPKELIIETQKASLRLIRGEFSELNANFQNMKPIDSINIMHDKTSSLFSLCALGAYMLNTNTINDELLNCFKELGSNIGTCFQIMDDILDIKANENISGKKQGTDFIEKKPSLIVTLWLNKKTRNFNDYINSPNVSNLLLEDIKNDINNFNIIEEALEYFNEYFNNTIKQIKFLEKNHLVINKNQLLSLKNYLSSIRYKVSQFI